MFNLLPEDIKKTIRTDYRLRFWVVAIAICVFVQVSFLIFLSPSWLLSFYTERDLVSQTESVKRSSETADAQSIASQVSGINSKINIVTSSLEYPRLVPIVNAIISNKTRSITLTQFAISLTGPKSGSVTLAGVSATRESLVAFVKSLEDSKMFSHIDLPISKFTRNKNISFSVTTTLI